MKEFIALLTYVFEFLELIVVARYIIGLKRTESKRRALIIPILVVMGVGTYFEASFEFLGSLVLAAALIFLCFDGEKRLSVLSIIMSWFTVSFMDLMMWLICAAILPLGKHYQNYMDIIEIISNVIGIVPLILIGYIMKKKNIVLREKLRDIHIVKYLLLILVIIAMCVVSACMQGLVLGEITYGTRRLVMIASIIMAFFVVTLCILYINVESSRKQLMEINALNERYIEFPKNYYIDVMKKDEKLIAFKHDIKKHMTALVILLEQKKYSEMEDYLNDVRDILKTEIIYNTGKSIADYIINANIREIMDKGPLDVQIIGKFKRDISINNTDICVILANIFDNVKDAILKYQGKRILQVEIRNYRERIYITVKNSSPKRNYQEGRSTKPDKENHGYGMKNVHQVVKKYHGSMETKWENDMFITSIEL